MCVCMCVYVCLCMCVCFRVCMWGIFVIPEARQVEEKRPIFVKRRPIFVKRDVHLSKENHICQKRTTFVKRDLQNTFTHDLVLFVTHTVRESTQKNPTCVKRDLHLSKEAYICHKRPTQHAHIQSSPICQTHGTWIHSKETCICQKRPTFVKRDLQLSKETYKTRPLLF